MLVELAIRDLALIESLELSFGAGLNAITGETGAGKSLLVGALELLIGERPRGSSWIREGAIRARVEGRFLLQSGPGADRVQAFLDHELPELGEDWKEQSGGHDERELILGRVLERSGRTRAHVNQSAVTQKALRALAALLFEIHGQNDHQLLLEPPHQLELLDAFGKVGGLVQRYRQRKSEYDEVSERLGRLERERQQRRDRLDLVRYQASELAEADLQPGERARLVGERELLRHGEALRKDLGAWLDALCDGDDTALDRLRTVERGAEAWRRRLPALAGPLEELLAAKLHLEEASARLSSLADGVDVDPTRLERIEDRLAELERLERKYGADEAGLVRLCQALETEAAEIEEAEQGLGDLVARRDGALTALAQTAAELSAARRAQVGPLSAALHRILSELGLEKARFDIALTPRAATGGDQGRRFGERGEDNIEFLLAANPGEPMQPLRQVASGGEAARVMLALRTALSGTASGEPGRSTGRTLVFDEVDAGIGGRLGPAIGKHLRSLGEHHQVLCVTHLPAIAAVAHRHLKVAKKVSKGRTRTEIAELDGEAREREIADMIAGGADQATARAEARRLLEGRVG